MRSAKKPVIISEYYNSESTPVPKVISPLLLLSNFLKLIDGIIENQIEVFWCIGAPLDK